MVAGGVDVGPGGHEKPDEPVADGVVPPFEIPLDGFMEGRPAAAPSAALLTFAPELKRIGTISGADVAVRR